MKIMLKMMGMLIRILAAVVLLIIAAPHDAKAALPAGYCDVIDAGREELPMLYLVQSCAGTVQDRLVGAVRSVSGGDNSRMAALGGMLAVESTCGTNMNGVRQSGSCQLCMGCYGLRSGNSSAFGASQFMPGTWTEVTNGAGRNAAIQRLGGCTGVASGSLLDQNVTRDGVVRGQFERFRNALCGRGRPPASDRAYWGSMVGPSILMADIYDTQVTGAYRGNAAITTHLNSMGVNTDAIIRYAGHNLGPGEGNRFMQALARDPNQSVTGFLRPEVIRGNPGLYCQRGTGVRGVACQPVSASQAARNMQNTMFNQNCSQPFLSRLGVTGDYTSPVEGGNTASCGVDVTCGLSGDLALQEAIENGSLPGQMGRECVEQGTNCSTGASIYPRNMRRQDGSVQDTVQP